MRNSGKANNGVSGIITRDRDASTAAASIELNATTVNLKGQAVDARLRSNSGSAGVRLRNTSDSNLQTTKNMSSVMGGLMDASMESAQIMNNVQSNRSSLVKFLREEDQRRRQEGGTKSITIDPYRSAD